MSAPHSRRSLIASAPAALAAALLRRAPASAKPATALLAPESPLAELIFPPPAMRAPYIYRAEAGESRFPTEGDLAAGRAFLSGGNRYFNPDLDVIIHWPPAPMVLEETASIQGGRHVRSIGGHLINSGVVTSMFAVSMQTGSLFCEGMHIEVRGAACDAFVNRWYPAVADDAGLRLTSHPGVTLQHCLATGIDGIGSGVHGDAYQGQGPVDIIRLEEFTFESAYQGVFVPQVAPQKGLWLRKCNARFYASVAGPRHLYNYWFHEGAAERTSPIYPVRLDRVYAAESPPPYDQWHIYATMPNDTNPWGPRMRSDAEGDYYDFSDLGLDMQGTVRRGQPPGGDFATAKTCGSKYRSPWPAP